MIQEEKFKAYRTARYATYVTFQLGFILGGTIEEGKEYSGKKENLRI